MLMGSRWNQAVHARCGPGTDGRSIRRKCCGTPIDAVYMLDAATVDGALATRLEAGEVFRFGFNYGADYHEETAFLLRNAEGCFCLVGVPMTPVWCEPGKVAVVQDDCRDHRRPRLRDVLNTARGDDRHGIHHQADQRRRARWLGADDLARARTRSAHRTARPHGELPALPGKHRGLPRRGAGAPLGEDYAQALIDGDPEIDIEHVGRTIGETNVVYLTAQGEFLHSPPPWWR